MVSERLKTEQIGKCNSSPILIFAVGTELLESILNKNIAKQIVFYPITWAITLNLNNKEDTNNTGPGTIFLSFFICLSGLCFFQEENKTILST